MARRKPRLFSFSREVEIANFAEVVSAPEDRRALEALIDAFVEICRSHTVTPHTLAAVTQAARHGSEYVRGVGITRLAVLTHYFDEAAADLAQIAQDDDETVRLYACAAMANTPEAIGRPLLERALSDPAWRVRKAAAQAAGAVVWPALLPALTRRLEREGDARVAVVLRLAIAFQQPKAAPRP